MCSVHVSKLVADSLPTASFASTSSIILWSPEAESFLLESESFSYRLDEERLRIHKNPPIAAATRIRGATTSVTIITVDKGLFSFADFVDTSLVTAVSGVAVVSVDMSSGETLATLLVFIAVCNSVVKALLSVNSVTMFAFMSSIAALSLTLTSYVTLSIKKKSKKNIKC